MNEFKVGDKVRLRDDLEAGKKYGGVVFLSGMKDLKGKELTIHYISDDGDYTFEEGSYCCSEEMLEKVFNDSDLLEFALNKLNITKEELKEEYEKNKIDKQVIEDMKKRSDDMENYCYDRLCSTCKIYEFQKRYGLDINCVFVYEYLFGKE